MRKYIAGQVESRSVSLQQAFEHEKTLRASLGDEAGVAKANDILAQIKQGTYASQQTMREALSVAKSLDYSSDQSLSSSATAAFGKLRDLVQTTTSRGGDSSSAYWVGQVAVYQENWLSFQAIAVSK